MSGLRQRQQASKGLMESFPRRSRFSSYVKKARSLLFFECRCGIFARASNRLSSRRCGEIEGIRSLGTQDLFDAGKAKRRGRD
jgi:hypothetical protein